MKRTERASDAERARREALVERLKRELERVVEEVLVEGKPLPGTIDEIEELALRLRQKAGERAAAELVQASQSSQTEQAQEPQGQEPQGQEPQGQEPQGQEPSEPGKLRCSCGRWARHRGQRERDVVTLAGRVRVRRAYYYCRRCDEGFFPSDVRLGLGSGPFTTRVHQQVVRLDALLPFGKAVELLWELSGVSVSAKEAQRLLERALPVVESYAQARWTKAVQGLLGSGGRTSGSGPGAYPDVLYVLADGVQTPLLGGWREMKVGVARGLDARGKPSGPARYLSALADADTFGREWADLAEAAGLARARLVVVLGDGAKWLWRLAAEHFPDAVQVLDVWHAIERLWEVGRLAFEADAASLHAWVREREREVWEYRTDALLSALGELAQRHGRAREKAEEAIGYYAHNRPRMDYPRYRQMGLQVGSGPVESACKQVVTQRLKGAGMRWLAAGAQAIARLRCLLLGDEWHAFLDHWNQTSLAPAF